MAHNISMRQRARALLDLPASDWTGRVLEVTCTCTRLRYFDPAALQGHFRAPNLAAALRRLRCANCRRPPARVRLLVTSGAERAPDIVVLDRPGTW